jgi:hypothetical protein
VAPLLRWYFLAHVDREKEQLHTGEDFCAISYDMNPSVFFNDSFILLDSKPNDKQLRKRTFGEEANVCAYKTTYITYAVLNDIYSCVDPLIKPV